jgi:hypothetical protein
VRQLGTRWDVCIDRCGSEAVYQNLCRVDTTRSAQLHDAGTSCRVVGSDQWADEIGTALFMASGPFVLQTPYPWAPCGLVLAMSAVADWRPLFGLAKRIRLALRPLAMPYECRASDERVHTA